MRLTRFRKLQTITMLLFLVQSVLASWWSASDHNDDFSPPLTLGGDAQSDGEQSSDDVSSKPSEESVQSRVRKPELAFGLHSLLQHCPQCRDPETNPEHRTNTTKTTHLSPPPPKLVINNECSLCKGKGKIRSHSRS